MRLIEERQVPHFKLDFVKEVNRRPKFVFVACESVPKGRLFSVMLFYSFFKSLVGKDVVVELKNDLAIAGTLHSVDQVSQHEDSHSVYYIVKMSSFFGVAKF